MKKKKTDAGSNEYWTYPHLTEALEVGLYYGFTPIGHPPHEKSKPKNLEESHVIRLDEKASLVKHYFTNANPQNPVMVAYKREEKKAAKECEYAFEILGTTRSIADATLIKTLYEIALLEECEEVVVEVNSIGDRDSFTRYTRELGNYIRKRLVDLEPECRQRVKKDSLELSKCNHEKCKDVRDHAPQPMNFLSEPSRSHFMEVLELLETTCIPYTINSLLMDNVEYGVHTIFRISGVDGPKKERRTIAEGARWANIAKKMGLKKDVPGISGVLVLRKAHKPLKVKRILKPRLYFVQMGQEAKLKSLALIETLRKEKIPVYHSLAKDKLVAQLTSAEHLKTPYVLIMGQKESLENTVLVRELNYRSQDTIKVTEVANFLRKLLK